MVISSKSYFCRLIHQSASPHLVIVLEDLSPFGFTTTDKPPADFEASKMIAKRLAKFHAASYFLANEKVKNSVVKCHSNNHKNFNSSMRISQISMELCMETEYCHVSFTTWALMDSYTSQARSRHFVDMSIG